MPVSHPWLTAYLYIIRDGVGLAELLILKMGSAKALVRDKRQKVYSRALFVSGHHLLLTAEGRESCRHFILIKMEAKQQRKETKEEKEKRLRKLFHNAVFEIKSIRIKGKDYSISSIECLNVLEPKNISQVKEGESDFRAQADIFFTSKEDCRGKLSLGVQDFHGQIERQEDSFKVRKPLILDSEIGTVIVNFKPVNNE